MPVPVHTHKIVNIVCLAPPSRGGESIISARCTCEDYDSGLYSDVLSWWERHLDAVYPNASSTMTTRMMGAGLAAVGATR